MSSAGRRRDCRLQLESLEDRALLSANLFVPVANHVAPASDVTNPAPDGFTPQQMQHAYGFDAISYGQSAANGRGQTIAIIDAYSDPNILSDLRTFDRTWGLADPPNFRRVMEMNGAAPKVDPGWALETALDVEWAHAIAPGANILLVEARSDNLDDLAAAVDYARHQSSVSVVSMSLGFTEFSGQTTYDNLFTTPAGHRPVAFVASAGDDGTEALWPGTSPNVLSVGGTSLTLSSTGDYGGETAWSGSGGGLSAFEPEPSYQNGVQSSGMRSVADVAYNADPNTGVAVYDSITQDGQSGWVEMGGTSAGAPQWAALIAIADQGIALSHKVGIDNAPAAIYSLPASDFHDITQGSNGTPATVGYDQVTGRGTPVADMVISDLIANAETTSYARLHPAFHAPPVVHSHPIILTATP